MLIAAFVVIAVILIFIFLPVSFTATASFGKDGTVLKVCAKLARLITLFGWDSKEEGLDFLFKKRVKDRQDKKKRLNAIIGRIFNPKSILNVKGMTVALFEVSGIIATQDAARTALVYGAVCSIISIIIPFIKSRGMRIDFRPDFQQNQPDFHVTCIIRVRVIHIIYLIAKEI